MHEAHRGTQSAAFEKCFTVSVGVKAHHFSPDYDNGADAKVPFVFDPLTDQFNDSLAPLNDHPDDDMRLSNEDKAYHQSFESRISLLCTNWNTFHSCKSLIDIKQSLDNMDGASHPFKLSSMQRIFRVKSIWSFHSGKQSTTFTFLHILVIFNMIRLIRTQVTLPWQLSLLNFSSFDQFLNGAHTLLGIAWRYLISHSA